MVISVCFVYVCREEMKSQHAFELLAQSLGDEIAAQQKALAEATNTKASKEEAIGQVTSRPAPQHRALAHVSLSVSIGVSLLPPCTYVCRTSRICLRRPRRSRRTRSTSQTLRPPAAKRQPRWRRGRGRGPRRSRHCRRRKPSSPKTTSKYHTTFTTTTTPLHTHDSCTPPHVSLPLSVCLCVREWSASPCRRSPRVGADQVPHRQPQQCPPQRAGGAGAPERRPEAQLGGPGPAGCSHCDGQRRLRQGEGHDQPDDRQTHERTGESSGRRGRRHM